MAERVKVTISASGAHPDVLTVQDAMRQVLDIFDLLTAGPDGSQGVEWKLSKASTNSPFHAEGEAVSLEPTVDVSVVARAQKQFVAAGLASLEAGEVPENWDDKRVGIAKRLFRRNLNGVGRTDITFENIATVIVTPVRAEVAVSAIEATPSGLYDFPKVREEVGSIEGKFHLVSTFRNQPAIAVLDPRTNNQVWCVISEALRIKFADKASIEDFWQHSRVRIGGRIRYGNNGVIQSVIANDVTRIEPRPVQLQAIRDPDFTGDLTTSEYLEKFREGLLG